MGLPGSGKTTYAQQQRWPLLSSDEIRRMLMDDARDQTVNRQVFLELRRWLRLRLETGRPVTCIDATSLTAQERRPYLKTAQMYGAEIEAVVLATPLDVCKQRNRNRERVVPDDVLDRMAGRLKIPTLEEGFSKVTTVSPDGATTVVP